MVGEVARRLDGVYEFGGLHMHSHCGAGLAKAIEGFFGRLPGPGKLFLVENATHAHFCLGNGNDPKPFIFQANNKRIAGASPFIESNDREVTKNRKLSEVWMDNPQAFLIAREVASTTGINEKGRLELAALAVVTPGFHESFVVVGATLRYRPAFAHLRPGSCGVLEQQVIKDGSLDLKGAGLTGETAIAKNEFQSFAGISKVELGS